MGRSGSWAVRLGVAAVAVAAGAGAAWGFEGDEPTPASSAPDGASAPAPTTSVPLTADEVMASIEVEAGATPGQVVACDSPGGRATGWYPSAEQCPPAGRAVIGDGLSYGIVVENTGDQVLVGVPVTYRFLADDGTVVPEPATAFSDDDPTSDETAIPVLRPGQRYGFGGMTYRERPGATRIEVEVGEPSDWMPEMAGAERFGLAHSQGRVETSDVALGYGDRNEPIVRFDAVLATEADPPEGGLPNVVAYAVYRDAGGRIIGGADTMFTTEIPTGEPSAFEIPLDDPLEVPGIDPTRVELYFDGYPS